MKTLSPSVFVIDDDADVRTSLKALFQFEHLKVEVFPSAEAFLAKNKFNRPACVVSDIRMPGLSGLELQDACEKKGIFMPMVFITGHGDIPMSVQAMKKGAFDFLPKPFDADALLKVVRQAINKDQRDHQRHRRLSRIRRRLATLSEREHQIFKNVVAGHLSKQIALKYGLAEQTIKFHRANIMRKLKATSTSHLVRLAEADGELISKN